jgi:peptidoglycan hydrolase-like protein with peptidoglycan-binding domain
VVGAREPSSLLQNMSLSALADRMDVGSVLRWSRRRAYPPILKDLQVIAWIQRNPITLPEFADRLCRPWRTLQFARRHGDPAGAAAIARSVATLWAPTNTVVPPSFVIEVLLAPIAGTRPRLEAIRNPDYGEGVIAASVDDGALKIRRINGSTVELLATGPDTGAGFHAPQVGTIRFDTTGLFGNELYVCLWGDIGGTRGLWDRTIVLRISAEGEVTRVAVCGNEIEPVAVLLEFAAGHGGYRRGAYLGQFAWNPRPRPANDLYHMSVAFNITKLAQDVLPPGRTNLTVWAMEFDPTGLYGSYLTLADSDDDDALTAVYQLRPDLSWSELTTLVSRWGRLYGDLAFSPGGGFGQKLYVTDRVSQSVMTVDPNGVHREFAMGFCGIDSVTISQDGDQMFVSDADGVYRIRPISRP